MKREEDIAMKKDSTKRIEIILFAISMGFAVTFVFLLMQFIWIEVPYEFLLLSIVFILFLISMTTFIIIVYKHGAMIKLEAIFLLIAVCFLPLLLYLMKKYAERAENILFFYQIIGLIILMLIGLIKVLKKKNQHNTRD